MHEVKVCSDSDLTKAAEVFAMFSDQTRLRILLYLSRGERNVGAISKALNASQPTISHHLGLLLATRLVRNRRLGKQIFYRICEGLDIHKMISQMLESTTK